MICQKEGVIRKLHLKPSKIHSTKTEMMVARAVLRVREPPYI